MGRFSLELSWEVREGLRTRRPNLPGAFLWALWRMMSCGGAKLSSPLKFTRSVRRLSNLCNIHILARAKNMIRFAQSFLLPIFTSCPFTGHMRSQIPLHSRAPSAERRLVFVHSHHALDNHVRLLHSFTLHSRESIHLITQLWATKARRASQLSVISPDSRDQIHR